VAAGYSLENCLQALTEHVHRLLLIGTCGADSELVDVPAAAAERLAEQAKRFDASALVYVIAVLEDLRRQVRFSNTARALADAATVRLANLQNFADISRLLREVDSGVVSSPPAPSKIPAQKKSPEPAEPAPARMTRPPVAREGASRPVPRPSGPRAEPVGVGRKALEEVMRDPLVKEVMDKFGASPMAIEQAEPAEPSA
jgi:DNA polymerase III gamma/tau subunit